MSSLAGKNLVFTGTLTMKRTEATQLAKDAGAIVTAAISGKTDIVVAGAGAGAKLADAAARGIECITEDEFVKLASKAPATAAPKKPAGKKSKAEAEAPAQDEDTPPTKAKKTEGKTTAKAPAKAPAAPAPAKGKKSKAAPAAPETPAPAPAAPAAAPATKVAPAAAAGGPRRVPVDREVPGRDGFSVVGEYTIKLNQTNIGSNNNKFYIIQVLEKDGSFYAWNRWGRVGEPGQSKLEPCGSSKAAAISSFEKKFKDKTNNSWSNRANFVKHDGKYQLVETDETEGQNGESDTQPIGKLSKPQIEKGQAVLVRIQDAINNKASHAALVALSSEFFSLIPTDFGRRVPEPITTIDKANEKEALLKFYLRMGFDESEPEDPNMTPIAGVMQEPLPPTLEEAAKTCCGKSDITSCVTKGDVLAKKKAGSPIRAMNKELYAAILLYTSNAIYKDLNKVLRDENRAGVRKYFRYLRMLFEATDSLPQKQVTLWRGISVDLYDQYKVGSTVTWWGVSSCTSDVAVAKNFMKGCGGSCTLLTIDTKTACDISEVSFYSNEKESLLLPGTQLRVKSSKRVGKITEIELEEVGRAVS